MAHAAPGKSDRDGITLVELCDMFPTEESAQEWFEARVWPEGRHCPVCGSTRTHEAGHNHMPYRCSDCRSYFSVKTGTVMRKSHIPLRKWAFAIYLHLTSLKRRVEHETPPRYRRIPAGGVVHAPTHSRGLEQQRSRAVRRPGGGR